MSHATWPILVLLGGMIGAIVVLFVYVAIKTYFHAVRVNYRRRGGFR